MSFTSPLPCGFAGSRNAMMNKVRIAARFSPRMRTRRRAIASVNAESAMTPPMATMGSAGEST